MEAKEIERKFERAKTELRYIMEDIDALIKEIKANPDKFYPPPYNHIFGAEDKIKELEIWREQIKNFIE